MLDWVTFKKGVPRKINNFAIRLPAHWSRYYSKDYEKENYAFIKSVMKEGMHIIDIGAHMGLFSVTSSQLIGPEGKVICFEPTPGTYAVLKKTLRLNNCKNVEALQAAVSCEEGKATFYVNKIAGYSGNSLVKSKNENELSVYEVKLVTIDSIVTEYNLQPALIKIDAEGAELDVMKGGTHTINTFRPVIILGIHPSAIITKGDSLKSIWETIITYNYRVIYQEEEMGEQDFVNQDNLFDVHLIPV